MNRLSEFMARVAGETYPEPWSEGHAGVTDHFMPLVCQGLPAGAKVLDVGCGQGVALKRFKERGYDATGIALNWEDVKACHELGFVVLEMDQNAMTFADESFDLVWARHVLEHSIAPYFTLCEFARILKPGGWLYVEVPAPGTSCHHESNLNHYSVLGLEMWKQLINRAGLPYEGATEIKLQTPAGPDLYWSILVRKPEIVRD